MAKMYNCRESKCGSAKHKRDNSRKHKRRRWRDCLMFAFVFHHVIVVAISAKYHSFCYLWLTSAGLACWPF